MRVIGKHVHKQDRMREGPYGQRRPIAIHIPSRDATFLLTVDEARTLAADLQAAIYRAKVEESEEV